MILILQSLSISISSTNSTYGVTVTSNYFNPINIVLSIVVINSANGVAVTSNYYS